MTDLEKRATKLFIPDFNDETKILKTDRAYELINDMTGRSLSQEDASESDKRYGIEKTWVVNVLKYGWFSHDKDGLKRYRFRAAFVKDINTLFVREPWNVSLISKRLEEEMPADPQVVANSDFSPEMTSTLTQLSKEFDSLNEDTRQLPS